MSAGQSSPPEESADLGILFVHGIGQQRQGETLVEFADPLSRWLARWLTAGLHTEAAVGEPDGAHVRLAEATLGGSEPAHLYMEIDGQTEVPSVTPQRWLLAESWWAETFEPPKTRSLLLWMLLILPYMMLVQTYEQFQRARRRTPRKGISGWVTRRGRVVAFGLVFLGALPLAGIMAVVVAVLMIGLLVPIPQLSDYSKKAALLLSNTLGDSFVLVSSAVQFDAMVSRVADDLGWVADRADRVAVVAHSQGTAVSYAAITGYENPANLSVFITIGEAIKKLNLVRALQSYGEPRRGIQLGAPGPGTDMSQSARSGIERWLRLRSLRFAFAWAGMIGFYFVSYAVPQLVILGGKQHTHLARGFLLAGIGLALIVAVCLVCNFYWRDDFTREPEPIRHGGGKLRWADYYASADPVPNGRLFDPDDDPDGTWLVEKEVWNFGSIIRDHTTYTSSEDDFLGCMTNELFKVTGTTLDETELAHLRRARWRGWWRVWWLTSARALSAVTTVVILYRVWGHLPRIGHRIAVWSHHVGPLHAVGKRVVDALDSVLIIGHPTRAEIAGILTVFGVAAIAYVLLAATWTYWQKQDIKRFYRRFTPEDDTDPLGGRELLIFVSVLAFFGFLAIVVAATQDYALPWAWAKTLNWYVVLVAAGLVAIPMSFGSLLRGPFRRSEARLFERYPRDAVPPPPPPPETVEAPAVPAT
jgi:hypothetical protein